MRAGLAGALVCACAFGGCGGVVSQDLFLVNRSGSTPGAKLTLLVNEEGLARCDGGTPRRLNDPQIIEARTIQESLHDYAAKHETLAPRPGSVLSYYVRTQDGSVRFADNSAHQPHVMRQLASFVLLVAQRVCGLPQSGA